MAVIAIVAGGIFALAQVQVKRMFIYIVVAEVGYMVGGVWLNNHDALVGAVFHILNDALATLCLFLAVATVRFKVRGMWIIYYRDLFGKMPFTMTAFTVGALAMVGIPPTGGFFSKWYLLSGGIQAEKWHFVAALLFAGMVNIVLFLRIIEFAYITHKPGEEPHRHSHLGLEKAPAAMLVPLVIVSMSLVAAGLGSHWIIQKIILPVLPV
jgi:multicomponent Na+:H+ antiporter subunit D